MSTPVQKRRRRRSGKMRGVPSPAFSTTAPAEPECSSEKVTAANTSSSGKSSIASRFDPVECKWFTYDEFKKYWNSPAGIERYNKELANKKGWTKRGSWQVFYNRLKSPKSYREDTTECSHTGSGFGQAAILRAGQAFLTELFQSSHMAVCREIACTSALGSQLLADTDWLADEHLVEMIRKYHRPSCPPGIWVMTPAEATTLLLSDSRDIQSVRDGDIFAELRERDPHTLLIPLNDGMPSMPALQEMYSGGSAVDPRDPHHGCHWSCLIVAREAPKRAVLHDPRSETLPALHRAARQALCRLKAAAMWDGDEDPHIEAHGVQKDGCRCGDWVLLMMGLHVYLCKRDLPAYLAAPGRFQQLLSTDAAMHIRKLLQNLRGNSVDEAERSGTLSFDEVERSGTLRYAKLATFTPITSPTNTLVYLHGFTATGASCEDILTDVLAGLGLEIVAPTAPQRAMPINNWWGETLLDEPNPNSHVHYLTNFMSPDVPDVIDEEELRSSSDEIISLLENRQAAQRTILSGASQGCCLAFHVLVRFVLKHPNRPLQGFIGGVGYPHPFTVQLARSRAHELASAFDGPWKHCKIWVFNTRHDDTHSLTMCESQMKEFEEAIGHKAEIIKEVLDEPIEDAHTQYDETGCWQKVLDQLLSG